MKFTENSLVVDVIKISNSSYKLSVPAGDLLAAAMNGAVLRRHDLSTAAVPNVLYVPLSEAKLSSGTYTFTFASGDKFTASAADAYPAASSVSDKTDSELPSVGTSDKNKFLHTNESTGALEWAEGGSGGGVLVVTDTNGTLDNTWQEIYNAAENKIPTALRVVEEDSINFNWLTTVFKEGDVGFYVDFGVEGAAFEEYTSDSASGYPAK